jgi:hypothetical protein
MPIVAASHTTYTQYSPGAPIRSFQTVGILYTVGTANSPRPAPRWRGVSCVRKPWSRVGRAPCLGRP